MNSLLSFVVFIQICLSDDEYVNANTITIAQGEEIGNIETNHIMEISFTLNIESNCLSDYCGVLLVGGNDELGQ